VNGAGSCPTYKIDDLSLPICDLIHLDIEGYEYYALQVGIETITTCKPVIVIEMWDKLSNRFEENINEKTENLLNSLNYVYSHTLYDSDKVYIPK
jgi:hypothetical protein